QDAVWSHAEGAGAAELVGEHVETKAGRHGDLLRPGHADAQQHEYRGRSPPRDAAYRSAERRPRQAAQSALTSSVAVDDSSGHAAVRSSAPPRGRARETGMRDTSAGSAPVASPGRRFLLTLALGVGVGLPLARLVEAQ